MTKAWLQIRATMEQAELATHLSWLQDAAKSVSKAAMWALQRVDDEPILVGPVVASDVMLAGFTSAANTRFSAVLHNAHEEKESHAQIPDFSWGKNVYTFAKWAANIPYAARPKRVHKQRPEGVRANVSSVRTPTKSYYAVAEGLIPGIYSTDSEVKQQRDPQNPTAFKSKRCRTRELAEAYIRDNQQATPKKSATEQVSSPSQVKRW